MYVHTLRFKHTTRLSHLKITYWSIALENIFWMQELCFGEGATAHDCTCKNHLIRHQTVLKSVTDENVCSFYSTGRAFGRAAHHSPPTATASCPVPTRIAPQWTTIDVQGTPSFKRSFVAAKMATLHINRWPAVNLRSVHMFLADFLFHPQKPKVSALAFFTEHKRRRVWRS